MKYAEIKTSISYPDIWKYVPKGNERCWKWGEVWEKQKQFEEDKNKIKEGVCKPIEQAIDAAETEKEVGQRLAPLFERFDKSYFFSDDVDEDMLMRKANKNTLQKKLQQWCAQLNFNVPLVKNTPGASIYFNKFKKVPAIIVTAGPSLAQAIDKLKDLNEHALIIAVDTSFRSLHKRGMHPHFVNAHDADVNGAKFFMGMDTSAIGAFVNYINPATIKSYCGDLIFYYVGDKSIPVYQMMAIACDSPSRDVSFLESVVTGGSSVAHTALYLAIAFGCDPITYVGLDLSYPSMDKSHFETDNPKDVSTKKLIDVEDVQGRMIKTDLSFFSYKTVLERMVPPMMAYHNIKIFNSSQDANGKPAGIVHQGLEPLPLDLFTNRYCQSKRPELDNIHTIYEEVKKRHGT